MISKNQLKALCAYKQQKQCDEARVYVVEGAKMCAEALAWQQPVTCVAAVSPWMAQYGSQLATVPTLAADKIYELTEADLERLSGQRTPNQVWMLLRRPDEEGCHTVDPDEGLVLALDRLQDPGNLGTIIRVADWFGIRHILCSADTVNCFNSKVVQASMGSLFRTHLRYCMLPAALEEMRRQGHPLFGALIDGEDVYRTLLPASGAAAVPVLVVGNESKGISDEVAALVTRRVAIPNRGGTCESLNAGMAAAILISELLRKGEETSRQ